MDLSIILFLIFASGALLSGVGVIASRHPVGSALSLALSLIFVAAIFFQVGATFLGIVQLILYAGAILVLILFIIMMLGVEEEKSAPRKWLYCVSGVLIGGVFAGILCGTALHLPGAVNDRCPIHLCVAPADNSCPFHDGKTLPTLPQGVPGQYATQSPSTRSPHEQSDVSLIGRNLFGHYNLHLVLLSLALLAASLGALAITRKLQRDN